MSMCDGDEDDWPVSSLFHKNAQPLRYLELLLFRDSTWQKKPPSDLAKPPEALAIPIQP